MYCRTTRFQYYFTICSTKPNRVTSCVLLKIATFLHLGKWISPTGAESKSVEQSQGHCGHELFSFQLQYNVGRTTAYPTSHKPTNTKTSLRTPLLQFPCSVRWAISFQNKTQIWFDSENAGCPRSDIKNPFEDFNKASTFDCWRLGVCAKIGQYPIKDAHFCFRWNFDLCGCVKDNLFFFAEINET